MTQTDQGEAIVESPGGSRSRTVTPIRPNGLLGKLHFKPTASQRRAVISVVVVLVLWEVLVRAFAADSMLIAPLSEVWDRFAELWSTGEYQRHLRASAQELTIGFAIAVLAAVPAGVILGYSKVVSDYCDAWITALYATPSIALAPLFILAFGIGIWSKVALVVLVAFFPIVINTRAGIMEAPPHLVEAGRAYGASRLQVLTKVMLPSSVPYIVVGLRLGIGRGIMGVVVGELYAARAGLGYLVHSSSQIFDPAGMFVGVISLGVAGVLLTSLLTYAEKKVAKWR